LLPLFVVERRLARSRRFVFVFFVFEHFLYSVLQVI
jgi:hypothetical protein